MRGCRRLMRRSLLLTPRWMLRKEREFTTEFAEGTEKKKNWSCSADYNVRTWGAAGCAPTYLG